MKCSNSAFNAQGSRLTIVVVQVGAGKIYVAAVKALRKKETQDETQFTTKFGGKELVRVPVISFCKIFISSYAFDALLCRNWPFSPPNRLTLRITLLCTIKLTSCYELHLEIWLPLIFLGSISLNCRHLNFLKLL
jgi:hypothetical protein